MKRTVTQSNRHEADSDLVHRHMIHANTITTPDPGCDQACGLLIYLLKEISGYKGILRTLRGSSWIFKSPIIITFCPDFVVNCFMVQDSLEQNTEHHYDRVL